MTRRNTKLGIGADTNQCHHSTASVQGLQAITLVITPHQVEFTPRASSSLTD